MTAGCDSWRDGKTFPNIKISDHNIFWIFSFWPIVFESATPLKLRKSVISRACTLLRACNQNIFSLWLATYIYWRTRLQGIELLYSFLLSCILIWWLCVFVSNIHWAFALSSFSQKQVEQMVAHRVRAMWPLYKSVVVHVYSVRSA